MESEEEVLIANPHDDDLDGYGTDSNSTDDDPNRKELTMDEALETAGFGKFHWFMAIIFGWANSADAVEMMSISYALPQAKCEFKATDLQLGFLTAVGFAGMMIGGYFWGSLADVKGRIRVVILCQACNALFTVASSLSQSLWFLIFMRFFSGFGVGGTSPIIFVYVIELLPHKYRGKMTSVLAMAFICGQILVAGMAWLILPHHDWTWTAGSFTFNNWRIFFLVSSAPVTMSFLLLMLFPESPRYLIQSNRIAEAKQILRKIHKWNGNKTPYDDNYTINQRGDRSGAQGFSACVKTMLRRNWDLIRRKDIRFIFILTSVITSALSFSYYGLNMWFPTLLTRMDETNATSLCDPAIIHANQSEADACSNTDAQKEAYFETFLQAASTLPGFVLYMFTVDRIGRKLLLGVTMICTAVSVFFVWFASSKTISIVLSCLFAGINNVSWMAISLLTTEIFPTEIRSTARGVQGAIFNRASAVIASVVFGALISTHCAVPILLIAAILLVGGLLVYFIPNTSQAQIG